MGPADDRVRTPGAAFLLSQLGGHSSRAWAARLERMGLDPREVMLFRHVALSEGRSQRDVAQAVGLPESRIVAIVDRLEERGWVERRTNLGDRRVRALFLTDAGRAALDGVMTVSAEHEAELTEGLTARERARLVRLLAKIADRRGLIAGVHPAFSADGAGTGGEGPDAR